MFILLSNNLTSRNLSQTNIFKCGKTEDSHLYMYKNLYTHGEKTRNNASKCLLWLSLIARKHSYLT